MADKMNVYLITRPKDNISWCEDDGMVVIASDKLHAEKVARCNSDDFAHSKNVKVAQVDLSKEQVVLVSNTGA